MFLMVFILMKEDFENTMQISNQEVFKLLGTTSDVGNTSCSGCYGPATTPHRLSPKCPREAAGGC